MGFCISRLPTTRLGRSVPNEKAHFTISILCPEINRFPNRLLRNRCLRTALSEKCQRGASTIALSGIATRSLNRCGAKVSTFVESQIEPIWTTNPYCWLGRKSKRRKPWQRYRRQANLKRVPNRTATALPVKHTWCLAGRQYQSSFLEM